MASKMPASSALPLDGAHPARGGRPAEAVLNGLPGGEGSTAWRGPYQGRGEGQERGPAFRKLVLDVDRRGR